MILVISKFIRDAFFRVHILKKSIQNLTKKKKEKEEEKIGREKKRKGKKRLK